MSGNTFYVYILVLTLGLMQAYSFFSHHFSGVDLLKKQVAKLEHDLEHEKLKTQIAYYEVESVKQHVATLLPDKVKDRKADYQTRSLASLVQSQEPLKFDNSERLLSEGKELFAKQRYNDAAHKFKKLIESFPDSVDVIEAYFLMSECYYQLQSYEDTVESIETMVSLFPESELTGFALLRLSNLYVERAFPDDAKQILITVKSQFAFNPELVEQANSLLKKLE